MTVSDTLPTVDIAARRSASRAVPPAPQDAEEDSYALTLTLRDGGHALSRIVTVLNSLCVTELTFRASDEAPARCEIVVPAADAPRARARLLRCVHVLDVTARRVRRRAPWSDRDHAEDLPGRPG
ncbi:hypothetical protein ACQEVM_12840 [Streptomyces sp. CA-243310]|uniref:hypothetical protein n=1 Tax=Streptomyces sp. CA-243310 TaxID=3240056 RepID=UPI003D8EE86C